MNKYLIGFKNGTVIEVSVSADAGLNEEEVAQHVVSAKRNNYSTTRISSIGLDLTEVSFIAPAWACTVKESGGSK